MTSGGEELRDTGSVESCLCKTKGSSQARATGTDDDGIVLVVLRGVARSVDTVSMDLLHGVRWVVQTYYNGVLGANEGGRLLGSQRSIREYLGCKSAISVYKRQDLSEDRCRGWERQYLRRE